MCCRTSLIIIEESKGGKFYAIDMILYLGDYRYDIAWSYMNIMRAAKFDKDTGIVEFAEDFLTE